MLRLARLLTILLGLAALSAGPADAKRVAFVVGINAYNNLKPDQQLRKAVNDARAIGAALNDVGFQVIQAEDATRNEFLRTWQRFLNSVEPGDVATIFFAGHGIELNGVNFLLPRDVPRPDDGEELMRGTAIRVSALMERLREQNPQVAVWIIDACRDSPYAGPGVTRSVGSTRGLKREEPPKGTLVMMSAGTGQGALDALSLSDASPNSVYTRTLLPLLKQPGLEITDLAKRVRTQVEMLASTIGRDQRPAFYHELSGDFFLVAPTRETSSSPAASSVTGLSEAALGWSSVKDVTNPELLEAFIRQFNGTFYAGLAQAKLTELRKSQTLAAPPLIAMASDPAAAIAGPDSLSRTQSAPGPNRRPSSAMEAAQAWLAVKDSTDPQLLDAFLQRHGDSIYAAQARNRIADLRDESNSSKMAAIVPQRPAAAKSATPAVGIFPQTRSAPLSASQERALKPKDAFEECANCPEMVVVPAGSFTIGSPENEPGRAGNEGPQHTVSIAKAFAVGKFAVSFADWEACLAAGGCNGYKPADQAGRRGRHPVINVSWNDAKAYLEWLSKTTGKPYRLLSEAEREYVARAGSTTPFWFGATISSKQANYNGTIADAMGEKGEFRQRTLPVDFFAANPFGLHQVHGNVYEWTEDCWRPSYAGAPSDGSARTQAECGARTIRGGSLADAANALRSAARSGYAPDNRSERIGFRVARSL